MSGPLTGCRVVEVASIGPGPYGAMLLADLGADIVRVERPQEYASNDSRRFEVMLRNRRSVPLDLKTSNGVEGLLALVDEADALVEGFRPGVMERLGIGPEVCLNRNQRLVYGRITGWGQDGPLSHTAGHDINYISVAGCLAHLTAGGVPKAPLNLLGDFGAGGPLLALGVLAGIIEARTSGVGQVVDAAMFDGTATLMSMFHGYDAAASQAGGRDPFGGLAGAPYYGVYACADGEFVSVGAAEPQFYAQLLDLLGLAAEPELARQADTSRWPVMTELIGDRIRTKTRDEWIDLATNYDACFTPVLTIHEARDDPHARSRGTFTTVDDVTQPAPVLRWSRTPSGVPRSPSEGRSDLETILDEWQGSGRWEGRSNVVSVTSTN